MTFTVFASGNGELSFEWQLNGKTIRPSDGVNQEDQGKCSTIQLNFSPEKHAGIYRCLVRARTGRRLVKSNSVELKGK